MQKVEVITHEDLREEIRAVERDMKRWVIGAVGSLSIVGFGAFAAVWKDASDTAAVIGGVSAQVSHNVDAVRESLESQRRVEAGLSEINRYLREDSREQRDAMQQHIRTGHPGSGR